jgi:NAD(P)-dependent dehydrogenase (short-subunit alcohol dehydrogenase family)
MNLRGAVVVVTGASSGIGEATARALAQRGSTVVVVARRLDRLRDLAARIEEDGGVALPVRCDVERASDIEALARTVDERLGRCDALVNNAGIPGGGRLEDASVEQIERVVRVNLLGVILATRAFAPMMRRRGGGQMVNVASLAGRFAVPGASVYAATKYGVVGFTESLIELRDAGITATAILPGFVPTEAFSGRGPRPFRVTVDQVVAAIVRAIARGTPGEIWLPAWTRPLEVFRVATPGLYRRVADASARRSELQGRPPPR